MTTKQHDGTTQHHETAPRGRPVLREKTEDAIATKQLNQNEKSIRHNYSIEDKRKEARIEHTNGSTPRRDL